jgi:hypothetical protein
MHPSGVSATATPRVGVSERSVSSYEKGEQQPEQQTLKRAVADELLIPAEEINAPTFGLMLNVLKGGMGVGGIRGRSSPVQIQLVPPSKS